jgi:hypothetical protein
MIPVYIVYQTITSGFQSMHSARLDHLKWISNQWAFEAKQHTTQLPGCHKFSLHQLESSGLSDNSLMG